MHISPSCETEYRNLKTAEIQKPRLLLPAALLSQYALRSEESRINITRILPPLKIQSKKHKYHYSEMHGINKLSVRIPRIRRRFQYTGAKDPALATQFPESNEGVITTPSKTNSNPELSPQIALNKKCKIGRTRYTRGSVDGIQGLHHHVRYEKNGLFHINRPYQQEFTRVELESENGAPFNYTRSGLCAYCPGWNFYELKNSNYAKHLSHNHGIYPDNTLAPDPLDLGLHYQGQHTSSPPGQYSSNTAYMAVRCPACSCLIQIRLALPNRLLSLKPYLRHYKDKHRVTEPSTAFILHEVHNGK